MIIDEALARECPRPGLALELTTRDPLVKKALLTMQQTLDTTLTVADLAARLDVSRRKLEPHFTETLQVTAWEAGKMIRLAQARLLLKRSERSVTEIANEFEISRPAISQHLRILGEAGLVDIRPEGTRRYYRARPEGLRELRNWLDEFWTSQLGDLKREVEHDQSRKNQPTNRQEGDAT